MRGVVVRFLGSRRGSMMPLFFLTLLPIISAVGFSVDYTSAIQTRSNQQQALDAALLSITTMDTTSTLAQRQTALQDSFIANGGQGTATLNNFVAGTTTAAATGQASATFSMPTIFMKIARIDTVPVAVASAVSKPPALVNASFKISKVSGWWNKTMTLYGTQFGATTAKPLMSIDYIYNGFGDPKGYGTTNVYTITNNGGADIKTLVQSQVCTTTKVNNFNNLPAGAITQTSGSTKYVTTCVDTMYPANSAGAAIDVSQMGGLSLQMYVPSGNPQYLTSDDASTSNRLYSGVDANTLIETATGTKVDIFAIVPCGVTSYQAWEDGGTTVPTPSSNADFFYNVTGKCDFNKRPSDTALTQ
ncbi:TadE/TadG family type IV pilus assembly protein [Mesorhizobium carmichaelinearum]|uniref:TadE/TadG family type IV pilus assembly protein n=1 Tax=Mesorhizobium carmichaelinearum TaxID=1208188 RepID=UPI001FCE5967|nr:TadE/TadG family type IV pilus assembly protein [Mesorhizobium carmichaelinearum]